MKQYIVDAFTGKPFSGNPAAVCVMEALTPLGQKNATNDHAVRDHVYDLGIHKLRPMCIIEP